MKSALPTTLLLLLWGPAFGAENPLQGIFQPENLKRAQVVGVEVSAGEHPDSVVLKFPSSETPGVLTVPVPAAGRDWTGYGTFTFEFASNSTIRWLLDIRNRKGEVFTYRVQPYQDLPVKAAITAPFLTSQYMNSRAFKGHWLFNWGNHIDLTQVESLAIRMSPTRPVTLKLGPLALVREEVADEVYTDKPVVDVFGQWIPSEWPGKVRSLDELKSAWKKEDAELTRAGDLGFCPYGGWKERKQPATGFFHTVQVDGKWWLVDPDGHLFFSAGQNDVRYTSPTPVKGREQLFAKLPSAAGTNADFYQANARLRYGEVQFVENWKAKAEQRMRAWGFNTIANWSDPALFDKPAVPFVTTVAVDRGFRKNWQRYPDAYSEEFARSAEEAARAQCARFLKEPYLIGYFVGNEPLWFQRNLIDLILKDPEPTATQTFVRGFLKEKGDTAATREALLEALSRQYFRVVSQAVRKADPNHMVLGIRWAGGAPDPVLRANDVFDVFSINIYRFSPLEAQVQHIYDVVKKPIMIGEFGFAVGNAPGLSGAVKDETERGIAYQYYVERAAALAPVVGTHYFQFCDEPVTGRGDGENYNFGFVRQTDVPYPEMVSSAKVTHRRMYPVHAGLTAPTERAAKVR